MTTETQPNDIPFATDARPLLASMKFGDPASCRPFIDHFERPLYNYLYWLTGDPESAADLFQRTMLHTYNNLGKVRKARSTNDWVFRQATLLCLEQARRRQQKRRSSWDNILRSGLDRSQNDNWSTWDAEESPGAHLPVDRTAFLVDALKYLSTKERAAILLACIVQVRPAFLGDSLQVSRRAAERVLLGAYERLAVSVKDPMTPSAAPAPKGMREKIRRRLLGLLSPGRQRKLSQAIEANEAGPAILAEEEAALEAIRSLPVIAPPDALANDAEAHLRAGQEAREERIATWGFRFMQVTVPVFILAIIAIILLPTVSRSLEAARVAAAKENLEEIGQALLAYSAQSEGLRLPPMAADAQGAWVPDLRLLYPRYIKDPALLVRPSLNDAGLVKAMQVALGQSPPDFDTAHALLAHSYVYTGYVLLDETALEAFKAALEAPEKPNLEADIETADKLLRRLKKDVEYFFVTDRADPQAAARRKASIPIMFEAITSNVFGREPDAINVLYLDGHVESVRFGSQFPATHGVLAVLNHEP